MLSRSFIRTVGFLVAFAVALTFVPAAMPQGATPTTTLTNSSMPTTTSQATTGQAPTEGSSEYLDESKAMDLKLRWKDKTFELVVRPLTKAVDDRFVRAGISGLGKGEAIRRVLGDFSVKGDHVLLEATSGFFDYSKDGAKMTFILSDGADTITNTKGLALRRARPVDPAGNGSK